MTGWQLYWLSRLDGLNEFFGVVFVLGLLGCVGLSIVLIIARTHDDDEAGLQLEKALRYVVSIFLFSNIGWFIPTTKEMAAILLIPKITNAVQGNEKLTQLPDKVLDLANAWIEELGPKKDK